MKYVTKSAYELITGWPSTDKQDRAVLRGRNKKEKNWTKSSKDERQK